MLLQTNSGRIRKPAKDEPHVFRGAVPQHEKLLLLAILAVVVAWIMFRVALTLFATLG